MCRAVSACTCVVFQRVPVRCFSVYLCGVSACTCVVFQAAEHVLGSVLCAPGCFSVYRCGALADVLPKYAKRVESAFDFLTKDMGEDRWLCTLLVSCCCRWWF